MYLPEFFVKIIHLFYYNYYNVFELTGVNVFIKGLSGREFSMTGFFRAN